MKQHISRATNYAKNAAVRAKTLLSAIASRASADTLDIVRFVDGTYSTNSYLVVAKKVNARVSVRYVGGRYRVHFHPTDKAWGKLPPSLTYTAQRNGHTSYVMPSSNLTDLLTALKQPGAQVMVPARVHDSLQAKDLT